MTKEHNHTHDENDETPAMRLRQAREGLGLSRAELAKRTGIPAKSIEKFEYGSQEPSLSRLQTLSGALDVTTQWIMGDEPANESHDEGEVDLPTHISEIRKHLEGLKEEIQDVLEIINANSEDDHEEGNDEDAQDDDHAELEGDDDTGEVDEETLEDEGDEPKDEVWDKFQRMYGSEEG